MKELKTESRLEKVLAEGEFAVTAEMGPPRGANPAAIRSHCEDYAGCADAVNFTDNQTAIVRMSSLGASLLAKGEGLDPVMQMTCRDRNRLALQADLLGAAAMGVNNVLCLSGDHQQFGDQPGAKNVYDIDSIQLVQTAARLRDEKKFLSGETVDEVEPRFFIGAAANPFADPFQYRIIRLAKKVKAGADFIQTQAVYDVERFERWMEGVRQGGLHEKTCILAGVLPPKSAGALRYMKYNVSGMRVPNQLIRRMSQAENSREEGVRVCVELIEKVREIEGVRGVHIMPVQWEAILPTLVEKAGLLPRPEF